MTMRAMTGMALAALLAVCMPADAGGGRAAVRKQVESSLLVSGTITIGKDGAVLAQEIDPKVPLGEPLTRFVNDSVAKWRFEPVLVEGKPVNAKMAMHLRLVAKPAEDGKVSVKIASTHFGGNDAVVATDNPKSVKLTPPQYPLDALYMGGKGTVYLIVQVGRDGKTANVDAEQVNLRVVGTESEMNMLRKSLTNAAVRAAKRWTFAIPTTGEQAGQDSWLVRVPVDFTLNNEKRAKPGEWDTYIPGPRNMGMPWAMEKLRMAGSPDALPEGGIYPLRQGAKLLTDPAT